jgi:hypothetical protein
MDLKVDAVCTIQQNMSVKNGLVQNVQVQITALYHRFIKFLIPQTGEIYCLPCITFSFKPVHSNLTVNCKQFPLRPAYATTFNGCQGLMLQKAVLDLHMHRFFCTWTTIHLLRSCSKSNGSKGLSLSSYTVPLS